MTVLERGTTFGAAIRRPVFMDFKDARRPVGAGFDPTFFRPQCRLVTAALAAPAPSQETFRGRDLKGQPDGRLACRPQSEEAHDGRRGRRRSAALSAGTNRNCHGAPPPFERWLTSILQAIAGFEYPPHEDRADQKKRRGHTKA